jgi:hypothetical protein
MASFLAARLKKLERQRSKPKARRTIAEFDALTGDHINGEPASQRVMCITVWPSDEVWALALAKQQARLTANAASKHQHSDGR